MNSAGIERLHDFVQPPPPSWMPQTIGWYIVFALAALVLAWQALKWYRAWRKDRYRRQALAELANTSPEQLSALLKRTAMSAWPRSRVASLTGGEWLRFLNDSADKPLFEASPANSIEDTAFGKTPLSRAEADELRRTSGEWIRRHRVRA